MSGVNTGGWTPPPVIQQAIQNKQFENALDKYMRDRAADPANPKWFDFDDPAQVNLYNNAVSSEAARIDREFQQSSAREAMAFESEQAQLNRDFQQSSAREAMAFEASEAQKQREYQIEMSNTAYQRAVSDLKAAGLNPALAYQQGGAAVTAGAMASGVSSSGSAASGKQASGSKASSDMRTIVDMLETVATNAKDERVALYRVFGNILGSSLGVVGKLA